MIILWKEKVVEAILYREGTEMGGPDRDEMVHACGQTWHKRNALGIFFTNTLFNIEMNINDLSYNNFKDQHYIIAAHVSIWTTNTTCIYKRIVAISSSYLA